MYCLAIDRPEGLDLTVREIFCGSDLQQSSEVSVFVQQLTAVYGDGLVKVVDIREFVSEGNARCGVILVGAQQPT